MLDPRTSPRTYSRTWPSRLAGTGSSCLTLAAILLAGAALVSGCSSPTSPSFDLTAPGRPGRGGGGGGGQVVVTEPTAIATLEAERIVARDAAGSVSFIGGAQWADRLPRLVQARLIQTFENTSRLRAVSRPGEGVTADVQINTELRAFQFDAARGDAFVEASVKLLDAKSGKIVRTRVFTARTPVPDAAGPTVAQGLDRALSSVLLDIVRWVGGGR